MNFIETLKSVGGVKPCPTCYGIAYKSGDWMVQGKQPNCIQCHGTGSILDLAPLLARPKELFEPVRDLISDWAMDGHNGLLEWDAWLKHTTEGKNIHVVGPRPTLTYEVARQLGGTAVVAEPKYGIEWIKDADEESGRRPSCLRQGYRLSLPIPPDATVLFVTDRVDEKELSAVMEATMTSAPKGKPYKFLTCVLALVSHIGQYQFPDPENTVWPVIAMHQEKP